MLLLRILSWNLQMLTPEERNRPLQSLKKLDSRDSITLLILIALYKKTLLHYPLLNCTYPPILSPVNIHVVQAPRYTSQRFGRYSLLCDV